MSLIVRAAVAVMLLCTTHCSPQQSAPAPKVSVERSDPLGADLLTIESDTLVDGKRGTLTLICRSGQPASFRMDLVRPAAGPPQRAVFAQMQVKGGPPATIELRWLGGSAWEPKMPDASRPATLTPDHNNRDRVLPVLHAFSRERSLTITPQPGFGPDQPLVFDPETFGPHLPAVQSCAALDRFPDREG